MAQDYIPTLAQRQLAELIHMLRRDWDVPGIRAAIRKASEAGADDALIAARATALARNQGLTTPALIGRPGSADNQPPAPLPLGDRCENHPDMLVPCRHPACNPPLSKESWRTHFRRAGVLVGTPTNPAEPTKETTS